MKENKEKKSDVNTSDYRNTRQINIMSKPVVYGTTHTLMIIYLDKNNQIIYSYISK